MADFVVGANRPGFHVAGVNWGRDLPEPDLVADIEQLRHHLGIERWLLFGEWRAHPVRALLAIVAIAVGVAMGLLASAFALRFIVEGWLQIPIQGSLLLFIGGAALHLFATTSMGIFFGTVARSMPQLGLLIILVLLPLQILSGGMTPRESMPEVVQNVMLAAPTTHFVELAQAILFRGAGPAVVWPQMLALGAIGSVFFIGALSRLRKSLH